MEIDEDLKEESDSYRVTGSDPLSDWRIPFLDCLIHEVLLTDTIEARWLTPRAKSFVIIKGELYKKSHTKVVQRYILTEQGRKLLRDIHRGTYGHHTRPRTLVGKAF
jgi:hypothetical protein